MLSTTMSVEGSIIDKEYNLLAYTDNYLKYKGPEVHHPFIKKVMEVGEIIVSQPGYMPICKGCRFQEKCPAKIEILHAIQYKGEPVGTISISAFNNSDNCLIDKDIKAYAKSVFDTALLIESILENTHLLEQRPIYDEILRTALECSPDSILCVDQQGIIINHNKNASSLFDHATLISKRFTTVLPENQLTKLLSPSFSGKAQTKIRQNRFFVLSSPIMWNQTFYGAVIRLTPDFKQSRNMDYPVHFIQFSLDQILGTSPQIQGLKTQISKVANGEASVLIVGETGTGKELVAKALHTLSARSEESFVAVNCAAIPEHLLESEFFGYDEGAFTGASKKGKVGLMELANGGTLFLDEIGDMPLNLQAKLLRVLQDGELRRLGGDRSTRIDLRLIAATNQDLHALVEKGQFRRDLYYRLDVIRLKTPALRERQEDVLLLAHYFLKEYGSRFGSSLTTFAPEALELLKKYPWPGNIRELQNVIAYAVHLESGTLVSRATLEQKISLPTDDSSLNLKIQIEDFERRLITNALAEFGNTTQGKRQVAESLDIGIRTLYRKLEQLGL
jgi:transcriptional regulator with PAS, ATPase and Fis domain